MKRFFLFFLCFILTIIAIAVPVISSNATEILWDTWGVPHIYAKNDEKLFEAFGWAQAHSHGNLILRLYAQARGKSAHYWGASFLSDDQYTVMMGIPQRAQQWYEQQTPDMRTNLDAFAQGINHYVEKHPNEIDDALKVVLPVTGVDILAHLQRVIYFHFLTNPQQVNSLVDSSPNAGSNGWVIASKKSSTNQALLLANPHLPWSDFALWYEAQLSTPEVNISGAALVGMPVLGIGFNDNLGWTVTVNPIDGADIYELTLKEDGYVWDGEIRPFETETIPIQVKQSNNNELTVDLKLKRSVHGVIIAQKGDRAYALRVVGLDRPHGFTEFWQLAKAKGLEDFEKALESLQIPLFNFLYADRNGQIYYSYNGLIPVRKEGTWQDWRKIMAGDTSQTLWTDYHPYSALPQLKNPPNGWLQNTNDPPWTSTLPPLLQPSDYPPYLAPPSLGVTEDILRTQRSLKLLQEKNKISLDDLVEAKFSSRLEMADRILDILIPTAKALANPIGIEAAQVLENWDRTANADSRGAVLFTLWALTINPDKVFSQPWDAQNPLNTPTGIKDINTALGILEGVAAQMKLLYGRLDISWGEVVRMRYGKQDLPASGGLSKLGSFRVIQLTKTKDERFKVVSGDSFMAVVAFSDPIEGKTLTAYGNATQPHSSHIGDQLPLYAKGEMRPLWRTRQDIKRHLELSEKL